VRVGREQPCHLLHRVLAALAAGIGREPSQRPRRSGLGEPAARAQDERGQPVGDLHRPVGEWQRRVRREQPDRAQAGEVGLGSEAGEHVRALDALAGEQVRGQARARHAACDVVLQVGVEEAVAAVQLGGGADGEDRGVEGVEVQLPGGDRHPRVGVDGRCAGGQRQRLLVRDIEPA
jgi:hypothetical protein